MSRSGYVDDWDYDQWSQIMYRGAVASAIRGRRGQAFLKEMLAAMDALPEKKLIAHELEQEGAVCAIGSVGKARGIDMKDIDPEDSAKVSSIFGIAESMAREIVFMNDEANHVDTPERRFDRMYQWIKDQIRP
jgi:hypothetical protein